jgi:pyruvate dehydrogenase E2 component (dihydrolipoamide acetyltransferase)
MPAATQVKVPDIGDFADVPIIEVHVTPGDVVNAEDPLITLESDKATMDIPSPFAGTVQELRVQVGDRVGEGAVILLLDGEGASTQPPSLVDQQEPPTEAAAAPTAAAQEPARRSAPDQAPPAGIEFPAAAPDAPELADGAAPVDFQGPHAGPSVRRLARELEVDLAQISGSGPKGRITKQDLLGAVRGPAAAPAAGQASAQGGGIPEIPAQDFAKFGAIDTVPLGRIQRLSGAHLHRSWLNIPHVTHHDEADITEIDAYRKHLDTEARGDGYRVTLLAFLIKASMSALREFPKFNSSLTPEKDALIYKSYYNIDVAVDTPDGLVVPVIRDVDRKGIREISKELAAVSARARDGKLSVTDLQGGCFTISSLGGIGGTGFTPVVNAPEVAILGVVRSRTSPVWDGTAFVPRLMLPLSLSYAHRVIDGALAARFTRYLCYLLEDVRRLML